MPVVDVASQVCQCAQPILVVIRLKSPGFSFFDRFTQDLISLLEGALNISASQVQIQSSDWEAVGERLIVNLLLFPPNSTFSSIEISNLQNIFSNFTLSSSPNWSLSVVGPYELLNFIAGWFSLSSSFLLIHNLSIKWFCSNNCSKDSLDFEETQRKKERMKAGNNLYTIVWITDDFIWLVFQCARLQLCKPHQRDCQREA
jgi:hypothetical protein